MKEERKKVPSKDVSLLRGVLSVGEKGDVLRSSNDLVDHMAFEVLGREKGGLDRITQKV